MQKIIRLSARPPAWPPPQSLRLPRHEVSLLSSRFGSIGREYSTGTMRRFRFQPTGDRSAPAIQLTTMAVNSIKPDIMQLQRFTHDRPDFFLKQPRSLNQPSAYQPKGSMDELAIATSGGRTRLQTCLMQSGKAGYGQITLGDVWAQDDLSRFDGRPSRKALDYLARFLALQPSKLSECLLVQLETAHSAGDQQRLLDAWNRLKSQLLEQRGP